MLVRDSSIQFNFDSVLNEGIANGIFPGAAAGMVFGPPGKRQRLVTAVGHAAITPQKRLLKKDHFFDLASLTKPLATALAVLCLIKDQKISLGSCLGEMLSCHISKEKEGIHLKALLSHSAGLPAYKPYYKDLLKEPPLLRRSLLEKLILRESLLYKQGAQSLYSDLGFFLLGSIIEKLGGLTLDQYVREKVLEPLGLAKKLFFRPESLLSRDERVELFAATENCPWRKRILCGEVHDENTFALGGVSGQAGMFGNIDGVMDLATLILDMWKDRAHHPHIAGSDLRAFLLRRRDIPGSTWALGFDTVSAENSSAGNFFSKRSVGHLGFTGTSFWIDPEQDLVAVLLTNRVHPTRDNVKIRQFRPLFHDAVYQMELKYREGRGT